ncbi:hypothetical protein BC669P3_00042 [Bacteroides phage BC669P3]|nr:hypothetical protein BC669P3_00042 [Bacteroides phage BC669P3]
MFEILKVTVIFEGGKVVKYRGEELTAVIGSREVNDIETARKFAGLRIMDRQGPQSAPIKRVVLAYREKE